MRGAPGGAALEEAGGDRLELTLALHLEQTEQLSACGDCPQADIDLHGEMVGLGGGMQPARRLFRIDMRRERQDQGNDADFLLHRELGGTVVHKLDLLYAGTAGTERLAVAS